MPTSNIDDLLMGATSTPQPEPEHDYQDAPEAIEEVEPEEASEPEATYTDDAEAQDSGDGDTAPDLKAETDEYGNVKEPENEAIRERLARQARKYESEINALRSQLAQQNAAPAIQKAAKDFEYDPEASGDWQQQLAAFVKQTVEHMDVEKRQRQQQEVEQKNYQEFRQKFQSGMERFDDFVEVVSDKPLDDAMATALRGVSDPAAFVYAVSKRNPEELTRISQLRDPYARYAEMIRLEERMRKNKQVTTAPRPLGHTKGDAGLPETKKKTEPSIEDLIAQSDKKRLSQMQKRGTSRR